MTRRVFHRDGYPLTRLDRDAFEPVETHDRVDDVARVRARGDVLRDRPERIAGGHRDGRERAIGSPRVAGCQCGAAADDRESERQDRGQRGDAARTRRPRTVSRSRVTGSLRCRVR